MKNKHRGKPAVIIGNGPSLTVEDLERIDRSRFVTIGFNKFYRAFPSMRFRPDYLMVEDDMIYTEIKNELNEVEGPVKLVAEFLDDGVVEDKLIYRLFHKTDYLPGMPIVTGSPFRLYWGATVVFSGVQMAAYLGCDPIYLIGVDCSWNVQETQDKDIVESTGANHFIKDYAPSGTKHYAPKVEHQLKAFEALSEWGDRKKIHIRNATRGGHLEVFPRVNLDDVLSNTAFT